VGKKRQNQFFRPVRVEEVSDGVTFLKKVRYKMTWQPSNSTLRLHSREMKAGTQMLTCECSGNTDHNNEKVFTTQMSSIAEWGKQTVNAYNGVLVSHEKERLRLCLKYRREQSRSI
jgi:hypothetical protein